MSHSLVHRLIGFVWIVSLALTSSASAYSEWTPIGPPSAVTLFLYCHPTDPEVLFQFCDAGTLSKSTDRGKTWKRISAEVERECGIFKNFYRGEHCFAVDPREGHGNTCYFSPGQPGLFLYKSIDLGETWSPLDGTEGMSNGVIKVDYDGVLYACMPDGSFKTSRDGGERWVPRPRPPIRFPDNKWLSVDIEITRGDSLVVTDRGQGRGLFVSDDEGTRWRQALPGAWIVDVACSPDDPMLIVALGQDGAVYRSGDAGETFSNVHEVNQGNYWKPSTWPPHRGGIGINSAGTVIAIGRYSLARSTDGGRTFEDTREKDVAYTTAPWWPYADRGGKSWWPFTRSRVNDNLLKCCDLRASPIDPSLWIYGDGSMNKISFDDGESWIGGYGNGIHGLWSYGPAMGDPDQPDTIHVCTVDFGHSYTTDMGKTWHSTERERCSVQGIGYDPHDPETWYKLRTVFGTDRGVQVLTASKRGQTTDWKELAFIPGGASGYMGRIIVDPSDPSGDTLYVSCRSLDGIYKSIDRGRIFTLVREHADLVDMTVTAAGNVYAFAFTKGRGISRYLKGEDRWDDLAPGRMINGFAVDPTDENRLYMNADMQGGGFGEGFLYTCDKALEKAPDWKKQGQYNGWSLYLDPHRPENLLMATVKAFDKEGRGAGILRSADGGRSWQVMEALSPYNFVWGFQSGGPAVPGRVLSFTATAAWMDGLYEGRFEPVPRERTGKE